MFPVILSSLIFLPDVRVSNSRLASRLIKVVLFSLVLAVFSYFNFNLGLIEFEFSENSLRLVESTKTIDFIKLCSIAIFFFVFSQREQSLTKISLLGILPFIALGLSSEVLIIMVIVSGCFLEDMINSDIPFLAKLGLSLALFGTFLIDPAYGHLYSQLSSMILIQVISFILVFLIFNNDLIFNKKITTNSGFQIIISLFFVGFIFFLKSVDGFIENIFEVSLYINLGFFLIRSMVKQQYLPISELFCLNTFLFCWLYIGSFSIQFIAIYIVLTITLPLINVSEGFLLDSKTIMEELKSNSAIIFSILTFHLSILYSILTYINEYSQVLTIIFVICFWFYLKTIFKLILYKLNKSERKDLASYLVVLVWGALLLAGVIFYA